MKECEMNIYNASKLSNGLTVITSENQNTDIVTISAWIRAGARYETAGIRGYAHLLEHMMLRGTEHRPSTFDISVVTDRAGAYTNAFTGQERIYFFIQVEKHYLKIMCDLLADVIIHPLFDAAVLENEKKIIVQELQRAYDTPSQLVRIEALRNVFGDHPLSHDALGEEKDIRDATSIRLREYYQLHFDPSAAALIIGGALNHAEAVALAEEYFGAWESAASSADMSNPPRGHGRPCGKVMASRQTNMVFDFLGPMLDVKEAVIMNLWEDYLGYGHTSALSRELRHKRGLVYTLSAYDGNFRDASVFHIETATDRPYETILSIRDVLRSADCRQPPKSFSELQEQSLAIFSRRISDSLSEVKFLGEHWVRYEKMITPFEVGAIIKATTSREFFMAKKKTMTKQNFFLTMLGPENPGGKNIQEFYDAFLDE